MGYGIILMLLIPGTGGGAHAICLSYTKDGIKHYVILPPWYPSFIPDQIWEYNPDAGTSAYSKVKIHLCTQEDIKNSPGLCGDYCYDEDNDKYCCDGDDDGYCDDDDDYIPDEDNPDSATLEVLLPLTIKEGMQIEIENKVAVVIRNTLQVQGTMQRPVSISVGSCLEFAGGTGNINHCEIKSGNGYKGGGVRLSNCNNFTLENSEIKNNQAEFGGGIYIEGGNNILIKKTTISGNNDSAKGGGIYCLNASPTISECVIKGNADGFMGGGIYIGGASSPVIINARICDNSAQFGGGVYIDALSSPLFANCMVCNNLATSWGGGYFLSNAFPQIFSSVIVSNAIYGSKGSGIYGPTASPTVTNTIVHGNVSKWYENQPKEDYSYDQQVSESILSSFSFCNLQKQADSAPFRSIDADPQFAGESTQKGPDGRGADADWSLQGNSPCINAGSSDYQGAYDETDAAGNVRPYNKQTGSYADKTRVDIGAYEFPNNPPLLTDSAENFVTEDITVSKSTDEDTKLTITLLNGYTAIDVDGDNVVSSITMFPDDVLGDDDDPAVTEYGRVLQSSGGDALTPHNNTVTGGQVVYEPANRKENYTATLKAGFSDQDSPSAFGQVFTITVTADNDPPHFTSQPTELVIRENQKFEYTIETGDADVNDTGGRSISLETYLDWITLADNGDGTALLTGTPSSADIGANNITLSVTDSGGNTSVQEFTLQVQEKIALQVQVENASLGGAPGDKIDLKASSQTITTNPSFEWVISREDGSMIERLFGKNVTWDTTGMAEGTYTAEVTLSDDCGNTPDSKTVTISLAVGLYDDEEEDSFNQVDDDNRKAPNREETDTINGLDEDSPAEVLNDMAGLDLNSDQRDKVVGAVNAKSEQADLTEEETNNLLGALDNLIIANPDNPDDRLTADQTDQALAALQNVANNPDLTDKQKAELAKTLDELISQQGGRENLSPDQLAMVENIEAKIDTFADLDGDSPVEVINSMSTLKLNSDQRGRVVEAIKDKSEGELTEEEANYLLGALDNLIIADPENADERLTADQVNSALTALENLAANPDLNGMQLAKLAESVDELIVQKGRENLSSDQLAAIHAIQTDLITRAAILGEPLTAGGDDFSLASQPVDASTGEGPLVITAGQATATIKDVAELKAKSGLSEFRIILICNAASTLANVPVYFLNLYNTDGTIVRLSENLEKPVEISLPVSTSSRTQPLYHDADTAQWEDAHLFLYFSGESEVVFETERFGGYGLFEKSLSANETTSIDGGGSGGGSSSNCFLQTLF